MRLRLGLAAAAVASSSILAADPVETPGGRTVEVRYTYVMPGSENRSVLQDSVAKFEAAHPNVKIKLEPVIGDAYGNKLLSQYAAGLAPDVVNVQSGAAVSLATRGVLLPLDQYPRWRETLAGRYRKAVAAYTIGGRPYAIPFDVAPSAYIYYNKDLFDQAKIPYPDGAWTWDTRIRPELRERDFIWVMDRLTIGKRQYGFAPSWPQLWMDTLLASSGVRMWDDDEDPKRLTLDDPRVVEVFQFAADAANRFHWIPSANDVLFGKGSTMQDEFRKGRIAMLESGAWDIRDMRRKFRGRWDIAPFPRFARGGSDAIPGEGFGLGIFATSRQAPAAWEFVRWMTGPETLIPVARSGDTQPSLRALARAPGIWLPAADAVGSARDPANLKISDGMAERIKLRRTPEWFSSIVNDLQGAYYGVLSGETPARAALANLQKRLPPKLERLRRRESDAPYPFGLALAIGVGLAVALVAWIYAPERGRRRTRSERAENRAAYVFLLPWLAGLALTVGPMIYSFLLSFADSDMIRTPRWRGIGNYADLLTPSVDDTLVVSLRQTFLFAALSVPLGSLFALGLALLLNQKVRGAPLFRALYYLPSLASAVAMALIWSRLFDKDTGLVNALLFSADGKSGFLGIGPWLASLAGTPGEPINWLGNTKTVVPAFVVMGLWGAGGGTIIYLAGLQGISTTYLEAATLDGAGVWRRFRSVTLPLLTPTLFFSLLTGTIGALQVFSQAFVLTGGGPDRATLFTTVWLYSVAFGELRMGYASAIAWILFVVILLFTAVQLGFARRWVHYEGELK